MDIFLKTKEEINEKQKIQKLNIQWLKRTIRKKYKELKGKDYFTTKHNIIHYLKTDKFFFDYMEHRIIIRTIDIMIKKMEEN